MSPKLKLEVVGPKNGEYYVTNEAISGRVVLELKKPAAIRNVTIAIRGTSQAIVRVCLDPLILGGSQVPVASCHTLVNEQQVLFPPENVAGTLGESEKGFQLGKGLYSYDFQLVIPYWPKCVDEHGTVVAGFNSGEDEPRLPPSFNSTSQEHMLANSISNISSKHGSVVYYIKAQLALGRKAFRLTPHKPFLDVYEIIQFIPTPRNRSSSQGPSRTFLSSEEVVFGKGLSALLGMRAQCLEQVHRNDYFFKKGCRRFDKVVLAFGNTPGAKFPIKVTRCQLELIELVNYLSQGRHEALTGHLSVLDVRVDHNLNPSKMRVVEDGSTEWPLELEQISELAEYRFNVSDTTYRGNKLYSFKCCNIKRNFRFRLKLTLQANGSLFETYLLTSMVNISLNSAEEHEDLPNYNSADAPPDYIKHS